MSEGSTRNAVEVAGLEKSFGDVRAVDGVDLRIPAGSFYGISGPNGAGKTTSIRMDAVGQSRSLATSWRMASPPAGMGNQNVASR